MERANTYPRMVLSYLLFFSSYLFVTLIFLPVGAYLGYDYPDYAEWHILSGAVAVLVTIFLLNRYTSCLKENSFYLVHLFWVLFLVLIGLTAHFTSGFENVTETVGNDGVRMVVYSTTVFYEIFIFFSHAFILTTLILIFTSLRHRKIGPILFSLGSLALVILFFMLII